VCGIVGVYEYGRSVGSVSEALIRRMHESIRHRGPDGEGVHVSVDSRLGLGHRRLAIVDPVGGAQPMFGSRGECLVFNGEIYNYPSLRRDLEREGVQFRTSCDTEVILHLYTRHGDRCLDRLNGMFAFALWDDERQRLLLARDRLGEKPLYWADVHGRLMFGSEIKAILEHPSVERVVNERLVSSYFTHLVTPSPHTLFQRVNKLPPGAVLVCDAAGAQVKQYWNLFEPRRWSPRPLEEAAVEVRQCLDRSVHDRLMSDVPVGVLLSGGLDSTTLVALLGTQGRSVSTFSVGFGDDDPLDERAEARWAARYFQTDHHEIVVSEQDALSFLPNLVHHQDEPLADPVCVPLAFVCRLARERGVKVVLAGEGADELFWGYPHYRQMLGRWGTVSRLLALPRFARTIMPMLASARHKPLARELLDQVADGRLSPMHMPTGLTGRQRHSLLCQPHDPFAWTSTWPDASGKADRLSTLAFDTQEYEFGLRLPELLLMRIDRFSMANGVEARVPFLDPGLVELVYRLPLTAKLDAGRTKIILRQAVADLVPERTLTRQKQGFGAPIVRWFDSRLGSLLLGMLDSDGVRRYLVADTLAETLREHVNGTKRNHGILWPVLNFALWHRYWIEEAPLEPLLEPLAKATS